MKPTLPEVLAKIEPGRNVRLDVSPPQRQALNDRTAVSPAKSYGRSCEHVTRNVV